MDVIIIIHKPNLEAKRTVIRSIERLIESIIASLSLTCFIDNVQIEGWQNFFVYFFGQLEYFSFKKKKKKKETRDTHSLYSRDRQQYLGSLFSSVLYFLRHIQLSRVSYISAVNSRLRMETSLRYGGDSKALRIHAKQKLPLDSKTHLQVLFPLPISPLFQLLSVSLSRFAKLSLFSNFRSNSI